MTSSFHSEKYGEASKERARQIEEESQAILSPKDAVIDEMNKYLAVVHTKSTYILFEKSNKELVLDSKSSIRTFFGTDYIIIDEKQVLKFDIWFNSPNRRQYDDIIFNPKIVGHYDRKYNLWRGFAYQPIQGNCDLFLAHM